MDIPSERALGAYVQNSMGTSVGSEWPTPSNQASARVLEEGIGKDRQDLIAYRLSRLTTGGSAKLVSVDLGTVVGRDDLTMRETRNWPLSLGAIDFSGRIRLSHVARELHARCD